MKSYKSYIILIIIAAAAALGTFYFMSHDEQDSANFISSYEECVSAGNPVTEGYPATCKTKQGSVFTQYIGNEMEFTDLIISDNPRPKQKITSPLQITGQARGTWFFEASFPAQLVDANEKEIAVIPVTAVGEWMTEQFVPYQGSMTFTTPETPTGTLILKKDNPSGLPENDKALRIPVRF